MNESNERSVTTCEEAHEPTAGYSPPARLQRFEPLATRRGAITTVLVICASCAVLALAFPLVYGGMHLLFPTCAMLLVGLHCPLCGGTRCVGALAHGDLAIAFYYNPLVVVSLVVVLYLFIRLVISCFTRPYRRFSLKLPYWALWVGFGIFMAFFVVRNLPFYRAYFY